MAMSWRSHGCRIGCTFAASVACLLLHASLRSADDEQIAQDEKLLKDHKVAVDGPGLLKFFQARTLNAEEEKRIRTLIGKLGDDDFDEREKAARELVDRGEAALRFLREALKDPDLETCRRADQCIVQ